MPLGQPDLFSRDNLLDPAALALWQAREMTFPPFVRRMMPDALDMATGAWALCVAEAHARHVGEVAER